MGDYVLYVLTLIWDHIGFPKGNMDIPTAAGADTGNQL